MEKVYCVDCINVSTPGLGGNCEHPSNIKSTGNALTPDRVAVLEDNFKINANNDCPNFHYRFQGRKVRGMVDSLLKQID